MATPGRREQHKAATRQALHDAARRMFQERGYAETTVRDIAAAAGVTERTFFRYFPSKEDLVLGEILDLIPLLQGHVNSRPPEEPPYTAVLNAILALAAERGTGLGILFSGPPQRFAGQSIRRTRPVLAQLEEGLASSFADRITKDSGPGPEVALRAAVLSCASVGAMRSALAAYSALPESDKTFGTALHLLNSAFAALKE